MTYNASFIAATLSFAIRGRIRLFASTVK